ncbi:CHRD domain-containing protein [Halalkalicoccus jeotgali]|nr:CHRD domain-containing protein [Halalkalicoccus jeotgali]
MTEQSETNDDAKQMPDFPLNRNPERELEQAPAAESESGQSRRGFLAASAAVGLGAAGMTGSVSAHDGDGDESSTNHDDDDNTKMNEIEVDAGAGFTVQDIVDNPDGFFVDVHTEEFVPGAIRGQIHGEPGDTQFLVQADGDQVVDGDSGEVGIGDPEGSGLYELELQPEENIICFDIAVDVTPPYQSPANTATHIHEAPEGEAGPPRVVFPDPTPNDPEVQQVRESVGCLPGEFATMTGVMIPVEDNPRVDADNVEKKEVYMPKDKDC